MKTAAQEAPPAATKLPPRRTVTKFVAPDEIPNHFRPYTTTDSYVDGFVDDADVRALLDIFGLAKRGSVVFPFQHIERRDGDMFTMRVEPSASHDVDGATITAHRWTYARQPKDQY